MKHNVTDFHHVRTLPKKKRCPARKNTNGPRVATHMQRTIPVVANVLRINVLYFTGSIDYSMPLAGMNKRSCLMI